MSNGNANDEKKAEETPGRTIDAKPGTVAQLQRPSRWVEGYSPKDVLEALADSLSQIKDIVVVVNLESDNPGENVYDCLTSSMPLHECIGFLETAKAIAHLKRRS
jgi:hypothetical protein